MATDDFDRANDVILGPSWLTMPGTASYEIVSNQAKALATPSGIYSGRYQNTPTDDQESAATLVTSNPPNGIGQGGGPACRMSADDVTCYMMFANYASAGRFQYAKSIAGSVSYLGAYLDGPLPAVGDRMAIRVVGTTLTVFRNGVELASTTDAAITSGQCGIWANTVGFAVHLDDWEGGDYPPPDPAAPADFWLAPIIPGVVG